MITSLKKERFKIVSFVLLVLRKWEGEFQSMEPHLHDDIAWFSMHNLPDNTIESLRHIIKMRNKNISFSEHGWK